MRLAFFSPFNPLKTGVADYSEELLPFLSEHCEIDLVVDGYTLSNADIRERYHAVGIEVIGDTPEQFAKTIRDDLARWGKVTRAANIRIE